MWISIRNTFRDGWEYSRGPRVRGRGLRPPSWSNTGCIYGKFETTVSGPRFGQLVNSFLSFSSAFVFMRCQKSRALWNFSKNSKCIFTSVVSGMLILRALNLSSPVATPSTMSPYSTEGYRVQRGVSVSHYIGMSEPLASLNIPFGE